ncbi:MAG TPA: hypothetical protein PJ994_00295 [Tepidiformaceae bacterium]|nr:hypothetical protein [Tepidiformaceae bacterium]
MAALVLVHSPLGAPYTWEPVARERHMPIGIYEEALPTSDLPSIPAWYLQFSDGYNRAAAQARARGFRFRHLQGTHFLLLDRPAEVAQILVDWFR